MHRHVIVGIDPGSTIGVAILDLSGNKLSTGSFSGGGISEAVSFIEKNGTPSLIACDVFPAPDFASKLASYFSCRLHSPARNIREEDKRLVARGAGVENNHERDAYCAAVFAFRAHANKLRQIDSLDEFPSEDKEKVKHLILKGYRVKDAFLELGEKEGTSAQESASGGARHSQESALRGQAQSFISPEELRSRASALARENAHLRMLASRLESEKQQLESRVRLLENGVRQTVLRDSELRKLRFQLALAIEKTAWRGKKRGKTGDAHGQGAQGNPSSQKKPSFQKQNPASLPHHPPQSHQKPPATAQKPPVSAPKPPSRKAPSYDEGLYNLGEGKLNLDKLVAEYRKGRK